MMKKAVITINGQEWPCRPTMGAMLRFRQETGHEVTEIKDSSLSEICTYLWCCIKSASSADGKAFDLSLMDFADRIDQNDLAEWTAQITGDDKPSSGNQSKKKAPSRS